MAPVFDIKIGVYNLVSGMAAAADGNRESRFIFAPSGGGGWGGWAGQCGGRFRSLLEGGG